MRTFLKNSFNSKQKANQKMKNAFSLSKRPHPPPSFPDLGLVFLFHAQHYEILYIVVSSILLWKNLRLMSLKVCRTVHIIVYFFCLPFFPQQCLEDLFRARVYQTVHFLSAL